VRENPWRDATEVELNRFRLGSERRRLLRATIKTTQPLSRSALAESKRYSKRPSADPSSPKRSVAYFIPQRSRYTHRQEGVRSRHIPQQQVTNVLPLEARTQRRFFLYFVIRRYLVSSLFRADARCSIVLGFHAIIDAPNKHSWPGNG
jgi:hypothetical protein